MLKVKQKLLSKKIAKAKKVAVKEAIAKKKHVL